MHGKFCSWKQNSRDFSRNQNLVWDKLDCNPGASEASQPGKIKKYKTIQKKFKRKKKKIGKN